VTGEDVGAAEIAEHWPSLSAKRRLCLAYDREFLDHLFSIIGARDGPLTVRLVRRGDLPIGWYAVVPSRGGSRVLHLSGHEREISAVFGELITYSRRRGKRLLSGRLEPHLDGPIRERLPAIGFARRPIVHSRDPELLATLQTESALLTRLDSEWWWA
jgi:hypothetical protein